MSSKKAFVMGINPFLEKVEVFCPLVSRAVHGG
jgi:hypothetical protein